MVVVTMTVGTVIHDLAVIHLVEEAYLPEDHAPVAAHPKVIAQCGVVHLRLGEIPHRHRRTAEGTADRQVSFHHIATRIDDEMVAGLFGNLGFDLRKEVAE